MSFRSMLDAWNPEWESSGTTIREKTNELYEGLHPNSSLHGIIRSSDEVGLGDFISCHKHIVATIGPGPHDLSGNNIKVGDRVAVAVTAGRSACLLIGEVLNIDKKKGIQIKATERTYGVGDRPTNWYAFSERMVVL